jgi:hypothetical protein
MKGEWGFKVWHPWEGLSRVKAEIEHSRESSTRAEMREVSKTLGQTYSLGNYNFIVLDLWKIKKWELQFHNLHLFFFYFFPLVVVGFELRLGKCSTTETGR